MKVLYKFQYQGSYLTNFCSALRS